MIPPYRLPTVLGMLARCSEGEWCSRWKGDPHILPSLYSAEWTWSIFEKKISLWESYYNHKSMSTLVWSQGNNKDTDARWAGVADGKPWLGCRVFQSLCKCILHPAMPSVQIVHLINLLMKYCHSLCFLEYLDICLVARNFMHGCTREVWRIVMSEESQPKLSFLRLKNHVMMFKLITLDSL